MTAQPKTDPAYLGRIDYPEYNCYVIRQKVEDNLEVTVIKQTLHRLDTDEEVGQESMEITRNTLTAESMLDGLLWKIDQKAARNRYEAKKQMYFSGAYQEFSTEEKMEYWLNKAHFHKRVSFELSDNSAAIVILNKGWKDQQERYNTRMELEAIVAFVIKRLDLDAEIAAEMLKYGIRTEEWAEWNDKMIAYCKAQEIV